MKIFAIANKPIVPVFLSPSFNDERIDELLLGMVVEVLWKDRNDFYYIETEYNYKGYVNKNDLVVDTNTAIKWKESAELLVISSYSDILSGTYLNSDIIASVVRGSYLKSTGQETSSLIEVEVPTGTKGWINKKYVKKREKFNIKNNEEKIRESIVNTAMMYLGTQFRWGGKSSLGVDSSGFVSIVYLMNEIIIWRDAAFNEEYLRKIKFEEVKKGDIIYSPAHNAIYLGNDKIIHSSTVNPGVGISSLNPKDSDYREDLASAILAVGTAII